MKKELIFDILQIFYKAVKLCLGIFFIYILVQLTIVGLKDFRLEYQDYFKVRGMETYGISTMAILDSMDIDEEENKIYTYKYTVGDMTYFLESNREYQNEDTKEIMIYYDSLEPEIAVEAERLSEINTFYSDKVLDCFLFYLMTIIYTGVFGVVWYLLDLLWYSKVNKILLGEKRNLKNEDTKIQLQKV